LLNTKGWRGLAGYKCIWRQTIEDTRTSSGCHTIEEEGGGRGGLTLQG